MSPRAWRILSLALALLAAALLGALVASHWPANGRVNTAPAPGVRASAPDTFAPVIERVAPAVVSIYAEGAPTPPMLVLPDLPFLQPELVPPTRRMSSGSGFFISADGYVLTNHHVVEGAERVEVVLHNERRLRARLIGSDPATDLAILKVSGGRFNYVDLKRAGSPKVGDWVIAIGNPFGLGATATAGIVSAYGRDLGSAFVDYVQIDAPINRGNSGGPSFDAEGRLVGVNTAILSPSGGNVGIGFAIPAETARSVAERLIARRPIERGYMGAALQEISPDAAAALGLAEPKGALVARVTPGGPAAVAGLKPGDAILKVDGRDAENAETVTRAVTRKRPGDQITLELFRRGQRLSLEVTLVARPPEDLLQRLAG
ncbi:MAG: trypsin-like peptidase domain-containing protein [Phenylobacterium sp.]|uniref:S1C family serine protease n=1 Tax=Phenylobacterium sp. TaxID=1871053 RepID=UPI001A1F4ECA|nr:trypsin-like peptidase domain-containing protein [Phenylobacterium sp.]MBJ7409440.1 trypsin-like peptidase domain-containing protein [Phenylobacterium sp.]